MIKESEILTFLIFVSLKSSSQTVYLFRVAGHQC